IGLRTLHHHIEEVSLALLDAWLSKDRDISHTSTAIGYVGKLKASSRIVWQMHAEHTDKVPNLLRQASYQTYKYGSWLAAKGEMTSLKSEMDFRRWDIVYQSESDGKRVDLSGDLGSGVLPVPMGVYRIDGLPAVAVELSTLGAFVTEDGPEFADFTLHYTGQGMDAGPDEKDLEIPKSLQPTMQQLARDLGLDPVRPHESLGKIQKFFQDNFSYSLYLQGAENDPLPLRTFLLQERKGHCEYFATAGVMLLRAAGIPARYAGGYAVNEYNPMTDSWLIRKRHAHAWALAFIDGAWQDLDYTPSTWAELESETTPWWVGITDLWTIFRHSLQTKDNESDGKSETVVWILIIVLLLIVVRWLHRQKLAGIDQELSAMEINNHYQGMDSPFFEVQKYLKAIGYGPDKNETLKQWIGRLGLIKEKDFDLPALNRVLELHYRYRFSLISEAKALKSEMQTLVEHWMRQQKSLSG
ncbi:MAG: transglutaminase domain-containing protein, partial [Gammaproteobacteria bacterium]